MTERTYEDAVTVLQEQIGGQLEGTRDEGRREMIRVLKERLGYSEAEARETLETLARSGRIRYITPNLEHRADSAGEMPAPPVAVSPVGSGGSGVPAIPTPSETLPGPGYWEIGAPDAEDGFGVRKGQVQPPE